ncbi:hypothetical protein TraAM80_06290 [Trypanosoma rangeli]|uniref:Uncharacterized protein n=1 Tax=Trypanosoma rangeli TaxID=5698 RepID=A0A3R7RH45_TRYRA|nr:uncharacterized protein TraAM80_06290 [Trypanosoma rangeli]RNF02590.1 hypothetical protein TraAM80_06290 [Trypanosoma rangeli]|eukprot:RNF02590.1 hypothetical protein TraAM80_06290 [Trypanosoma rangeli]
MLGLSVAQQQQPCRGQQQPQQRQFSRAEARRCLYCQQQGCQGLQSCWWPRLRSSASRFYHKAPADLPQHFCDGAAKSEQEPVSVVEENLRTQIRVLEREVELLRTGFQKVASIKCHGKTDAATMTSPAPTLAPEPSSLLCGHNAAVSGSDISLPRGTAAPSSFCGGLQQQKEMPPPPQEQKTLEACNANFSHLQGVLGTGGSTIVNMSASPPLQGVAGGKDMAELKQLMCELTAQNAILCRKLAEMKVVVEQRDELLQSIVVQGLTSDAAPASSSAQASTLPSLPSQPRELLLHLMQTQGELTYFREETRQLSVALKTCEKNLQDSNTLVEELRRQLRQLTLSLKEDTTAPTVNTNAAAAAITTTMPSLLPPHASDSSPPTIAVVASEAKNKGSTVSAKDAFTAASRGMMTADATSLTVEVRDLQERLAAAERKVLAWELWYRKQPQRPSCKERESQTKVTKATAAVHEGGAAPLNWKMVHQPPKVLIRALPLDDPTRYVKLSGTPSCKQETVSDALTIDTYALIARESALRQVAEQERTNLLAALSMEGVTDTDQEE